MLATKTILPVGPQLLDELTDSEREATVAHFHHEADRALGKGPFSVTTEKRLPPSGDPHDYRSWGSYWWPDPSKPDGLPWIRRDGVLNQWAHEGNRQDMDTMIATVRLLSLAYSATGESRYAAHAGKLLRTWFLDETTRMNPHLRYAQAIPGICDGRGIGLIDTHSLVSIPDSAALLEGAEGWTPADQAALRTWFDRYRDWFATSDLGKDECKQRNNHGTYYDLQLATYALFTGQPAQAREAVERLIRERLSLIRPDGSAPAELNRTRSYDYTLLNLRGLLLGASLARWFDLDVVSAGTPSGQRLRAAVNWVEPHVATVEHWPAQQITPFQPWIMGRTLTLAALVLDEPRYAKWLEHLPAPVGGKPAAWYVMFDEAEEN